LHKINNGINIKIVQHKRKELNFAHRNDKFMGKRPIPTLYNISKMPERLNKSQNDILSRNDDNLSQKEKKKK